MVFELTGEPDKIDAFLKMMEGFTILEMCRTGITAMERGGAERTSASFCTLPGTTGDRDDAGPGGTGLTASNSGSQSN